MNQIIKSSLKLYIYIASGIPLPKLRQSVYHNSLKLLCEEATKVNCTVACEATDRPPTVRNWRSQVIKKYDYPLWLSDIMARVSPLLSRLFHPYLLTDPV